jgi:thiol-disulfide isomerase/thioredoxin
VIVVISRLHSLISGRGSECKRPGFVNNGEIGGSPSSFAHQANRLGTMKVMKRVAIGIVSLAILAACIGLIGFEFVKRRIAANIQPPHLQRLSEAASDFTYRTLDGEPRRLASTKGQVVFLDLWGTWCVQCVAEMPTVQRLYDHYRDDPQVRFLIVSRLDSPSTVRSYASRNRLNLPFYVTQDEEIPLSMQLDQYPSTFIYSKDGTLVSRHVGAADWSDRSVISYIDQLKEQ